MAGRDAVVKRIADLVRAGAALTAYTCPACGTVLVRLRTGEHYCASCQRVVVVVKSEEEAQRAAEAAQLQDVRRIIFAKILQLGRQVERLDGPEMLDHLRAMSMLLDLYERLSRVEVGPRAGGEKAR